MLLTYVRWQAQDALNTAVFGDLISAVQPFVGTPMHTRRLFREWL
jgi:hypothetical protein